MKLLVIRHGETEENINGTILGHNSGNLTNRGRKELKLLREKVQNIAIDKVYTSDLKRCTDSAEIIFYKRDIKIIEDSRLREINFGTFQGKQYSSIKDDYLGSLDKKFPSGESNLDMIKRIVDFINEILQDNKNKTVAIICHSGTIAVLKSITGKISYREAIINKAKHNKINYFDVEEQLNYLFEK